MSKDQIYLRLPDDSGYLPDFVVETEKGKWLIEVKAANEMETPEVLLKAKVAALWCSHASTYEASKGGKPWAYKLVPDTAVTTQVGFTALVT